MYRGPTQLFHVGFPPGVDHFIKLLNMTWIVAPQGERSFFWGANLGSSSGQFVSTESASLRMTNKNHSLIWNTNPKSFWEKQLKNPCHPSSAPRNPRFYVCRVGLWVGDYLHIYSESNLLFTSMVTIWLCFLYVNNHSDTHTHMYEMLLSPGQIESQKNNTSISKFPIKTKQSKNWHYTTQQYRLYVHAYRKSLRGATPHNKQPQSIHRFRFFFWFPTTASKST